MSRCAKATCCLPLTACCNDVTGFDGCNSHLSAFSLLEISSNTGSGINAGGNDADCSCHVAVGADWGLLCTFIAGGAILTTTDGYNRAHECCAVVCACLFF